MNNPSRSNWISSKRPFLKAVEGMPLMQSFVVKDGRTVPSPVPAVMTSEQWMAADQTVNRVFRDSTPLLQAILARGELVISDFDAVSKMALEYQELTDPGEAIANVEGMTQGRHDEPLFTMRTIPLPFTSVDVTWFDDDHVFLDLLAKRVKVLAASVESRIRQALPINAQTLQIGLTPATFRLVMGMPPQLLQRDGRMPEFVVTCIIVPDNRTKPSPTTLSEATRSFDLAPQRRVNEVVEDVMVGVKTDAIFVGRKPDA